MKGLPLFFLWLFLSRASFGAIEITLLSAPEGPTSETAIVAVNAYIQSSAFIDSVTAEIGDLELPLERSSGSENNGNFVSTWVRNFLLPPLPDGPTDLVITVQSASGETAVTNRSLIIVSPPTLTAFAPFEDYVVHSGNRIPAKAIAYDEDSDVVITATAEYSVRGTNSIDTTFPVTRSGIVTFTAEGNHGQTTVQSFQFILQNNPKLELVTDVPGTILDIDSSRVLYLRKSEESVHINPIGLRSNTPAIYRSTNDWSIATGFLTPDGALVVERNRRDSGHRLLELNEDNQVTYLGPTRNTNVQVKGTYAAWAAGDELLRRDLTSSTTIIITNSLGRRTSDPFSLAENGDVSFSEFNSERIFRYRSGVIQQITEGRGFSNWTDGTNILYFAEAQIGPGRYPVMLYTPGGTVELAVNSFNQAALLTKGWVAFQDSAGVWVRTPSGSLQQRSRLTPWALNEIGEVLHKSVTNILSKPDNSTVNYGAFDGRPIYRNNRWEVIIGNTVFALVVNHPPVAGDDQLVRPVNSPAKVAVSELLSNDSDANLDLLIAEVALVSAQGATIVREGEWILYLPPAGFNGNDTFEYTVLDQYGGSATGTVHVSVDELPNNLPTHNILSIHSVSGGVEVRFAGIPGRSYIVQTTSSLVPPIEWDDLSLDDLVAGQDGIFSIQDDAPPSPRFYRAVQP